MHVIISGRFLSHLYKLHEGLGIKGATSEEVDYRRCGACCPVHSRIRRPGEWERIWSRRWRRSGSQRCAWPTRWCWPSLPRNRLRRLLACASLPAQVRRCIKAPFGLSDLRTKGGAPFRRPLSHCKRGTIQGTKTLGGMVHVVPRRYSAWRMGPSRWAKCPPRRRSLSSEELCGANSASSCSVVGFRVWICGSRGNFATTSG